MNRDALPPPEVVPPIELRTVYRIAFSGLAACALSGVGGSILDAVESRVAAANTIRLLLVAFGVIAAGSSISLRPTEWKIWGLASIAASGAYLGLPPHWDSARLLIAVAAWISVVGVFLTAIPTAYRLSLGSVLVLVHFGGIFTATTQPDPSPWLSSQIYSRVYHPYLTFTYMRNAYHFYSPEPGPASLLFVLIQYEVDEIDPKTGQKKLIHEWLYLPQRSTHMKDPLALTYYRRLAITEMTNGTIPDLFSPQSFEKLDARDRRMGAALGADGKERIPMAPADFEPEYNQYRVPRPDISRYVLPSYAKHLCVEHSASGRRVKTVKIYRLEHRIVPVQTFVKGTDPYHPALYRAYFLGEYDETGRLIDPEDRMLYWLVPILLKPGGASPNDPKKIDYDDYLSKHAGFQVEWKRP